MDSRRRSSPSPLFVRQNSATPERRPTPPYSRLALPIPLPSLRSHYPHDGFDFRRPVSSARSSTSANNVIDLTSDDDAAPTGNAPTPQPRPAAAPVALPRFGREIIDLSADASPVRATHPPNLRTSPSPEVQFVSSRPRSRTDQHPNHPPPPFLDPNLERRRPVAGLVLDDPEDDVVIAGERTGVNLLGPLAAHRRTNFGTLAQRLFERGNNTLPGLPGLRALYADVMREGVMPTLFGGVHDENDHRFPNHMGLADLPGALNYETQAFNLGTGGEHQQVPIPKFDPPKPAAEGFTRDPTEEDTIVCPNCEDELAVGDSDEKRQVWVVKGCGHVYCGTCMNNRKRKTTKSTKGKGRADDPMLPSPFAACRADDCDVRVSHKSDVMQIFL
ncbi:hypothetical protein AUEXF2481DRAFT_89732 [Aureobasidium subglaciale EXF-2481]|uniref:RING-type domain-containing protein n=1 Tax=Aureobasidium subglaciale (strain EXF-2481) TaxID=1043005 RepID=A0A074Y9P3_AURSE|nr:uncharacterized protein AUEXF2481DRAFT_89732 [Aureobasidium subglaciale EXF-2481]KAI5209694.1 hypothetical protein E4T38_02372 [Aureobasidium subglaciale]KAI5228576.1 hypothetical protein E4T40_02151 [Aureobasidium subglaciale]KAI5231997.1 hypothetical protein E4T41_02371 [Aureobasidium subglaciale]KAI5265693.1 hypothetical protein E4T46_02149 [Aureobasidium subglaciale]KEQ94490.1 hypothetical protein AUEXF2481DRAFT_89732 [Aureobasidium subglaciale EXF-2481]